MSSLLSTSALLVLARAGGAMAGFVTQILLARLLLPGDLGLFFSMTSLAAVGGLLAANGYPGIANRLMARYRERNPSLLPAFVRQARIDIAVGAAVAVLAIAAFALALPPETRHAAWAAALAIPAFASLRLYGSIAAATRRFAVSYLPDIFARPILFLAVLAILAAAGAKLSTSAVVLLMTLTAILVAGCQYAAVVRRMPPLTRTAPARLRRRWRSEARPLILVALFTTLFAEVAILLVTPLLESSDVAAFGLCLKLAFLVGFAVQVAHQIAAPELAASHARRDSAAAPRILGQANLMAVAVTLAATVVCAAAGDRILAVFGPDYAYAKPALVLVMASQVVRACFGPNAQLLTIAGLQRPMTLVIALSIAMLAAANAVLIPAFGIMGAAAAVAATTLFWVLALALLLYRGTGLRADVLMARPSAVSSSIP
jgi:O-antigen/teichoic acid export membrane protein